jgi:hypothetical protein
VDDQAEAHRLEKRMVAIEGRSTVERSFPAASPQSPCEQLVVDVDVGACGRAHAYAYAAVPAPAAVS